MCVFRLSVIQFSSSLILECPLLLKCGPPIKRFFDSTLVRVRLFGPKELDRWPGNMQDTEEKDDHLVWLRRPAGLFLKLQPPGNRGSGGSIWDCNEKTWREKLNSRGDSQYLLRRWHVSERVEEVIEFACWAAPTSHKHTHSSTHPQSTWHTQQEHHFSFN